MLNQIPIVKDRGHCATVIILSPNDKRVSNLHIHHLKFSFILTLSHFASRLHSVARTKSLLQCLLFNWMKPSDIKTLFTSLPSNCQSRYMKCLRCDFHWFSRFRVLHPQNLWSPVSLWWEGHRNRSGEHLKM